MNSWSCELQDGLATRPDYPLGLTVLALWLLEHSAVCFVGFFQCTDRQPELIYNIFMARTLRYRLIGIVGTALASCNKIFVPYAQTGVGRAESLCNIGCHIICKHTKVLRCAGQFDFCDLAAF